jgi:hypothetical protein
VSYFLAFWWYILLITLVGPSFSSVF